MSLFKKKKKNDAEEINEVDASDATDIVVKKDNDIKEDSEKSLEIKEDDSEEKEKPREEKRKENGPFKALGFVFKLLASAVLFAVALSIALKLEDAQAIVITITAIFILLLCIARSIFYLINRKKYTKYFKIMNIAEIIIDLTIGIFLLVGGIYYQNNSNDGGKFIDFMQDYYRYFVGVVMFIRGALHFFAVGFFKSKSTIFNYFVNLACITLGTFCMAYDFTLKQLVVLLMVLMFISCVYLGVDGIKSAIKHWNGGDDNSKKSKPKKDKKDKKKDNEIPAGIIEPETNNQVIVS